MELALFKVTHLIKCIETTIGCYSKAPAAPSVLTVCASRWWTSPPLWFAWTARSTLTSPWGLHMVVDAQAVSRERMPRRARVDLEELMMMRKIKKDFVQGVWSDASCCQKSIKKYLVWPEIWVVFFCCCFFLTKSKYLHSYITHLWKVWSLSHHTEVCEECRNGTVHTPTAVMVREPNGINQELNC